MTEIPQPAADADRLGLSALMKALADDPPEQVTVGGLAAYFGPRAFGAVLFIFAVPNLLPLPPGSSTLLGAPLLIVAPQLALGRPRPMLPKAVADRPIDPKTVAEVGRRVWKTLDRIEKLSRRRLDFMFSPAGDMVIGAVCALLALVLILPIPLGNMLPAASIAALALSLTQRDGVLALIGYALAAASFGVLAVSWKIVAGVIGHLLERL